MFSVFDVLLLVQY